MTKRASVDYGTLGAAVSGIPKPRSPSIVNSNSLNIKVPVGSRVILSGRRCGHVRFFGKLRSELGEWYGVELDEAKGDNDGSWEKERYFQCASQHGVFVRRKEIMYVKEIPPRIRSPPSPVGKDHSDDASTASSSDSFLMDLPPVPKLQTPVLRASSFIRRGSESSGKGSLPLGMQSRLQGIKLLFSKGSDSEIQTSPPRTQSFSGVPVQFTQAQSGGGNTESNEPQDEQDKPARANSSPNIQSDAEQPCRAGQRDEDDETAVETIIGDELFAELEAPAPAPTPFFLKRSTVGATFDRRASFAGSPTASSSSPSIVSHSPSSPTAAMQKVADLEKEMGIMRTNHENIVAVLRATNKQHAANVLELRAQVAALTEANAWLDKQLSSKNALINEMRENEKHDRITKAEVEKILAVKDRQIQILEREIAKLKQQIVRVETEKDSTLCQMRRHFQTQHDRDTSRIDKLRQDVVNLCNERGSLENELRELRQMSYMF